MKDRIFLLADLSKTLETPECFRAIWEELKAMDEAHFRFAEKDQPAEFASSTASSMQRSYPPDWVISGPHLLREVRREILAYLILSV